ncbi:MAG: peptidylprolyl isomerase [Chloroflexi bacterium]|nr:peptidylprolyl isomerase [Chloroflexota bacterium]
MKQWPHPPTMVLDPTKTYEAIIHTAKGGINIHLYADKAPITVNNFVFLAREHFYDGVTFHRVIKDFMAQTGDPTGTGRGGPGYLFADEFDVALKHDSEGVVAMANAGRNTNGSQFYITFGPQPHLDGGYNIFGKVVSGMDVLRQISLRDPMRAVLPGDTINAIEIIEK